MLAENTRAELRKAFAQRITTEIELSDTEVDYLTTLAPIGVVLYCFSSTGKHYKRQNKTRDFFLRYLHRTINNALAREQSKGFHSKWVKHPAPVAQAVRTTPKPAPIVRPTIAVDTLRLAFQECNTLDGSWTLSTEDIEHLLTQCDAATLLDAFKTLGRYDSDARGQQDCFDALEEAIGQAVWSKETAALTR